MDYVILQKTLSLEISVEKANYQNLLHKNITKDYKKADNDVVSNITKKDKDIAAKLDIEDRLYCTQKCEAFITLKDHKQQFFNNHKCRLINPCKPDLGMVSKHMLTEIISTVNGGKILMLLLTGARILLI